MGYFNSWRFHKHLGYTLGLLIRAVPGIDVVGVIQDVDKWAFNREWDQNLAGNTPNPQLGQHQTREAMAFGAGLREATGLDAPWILPSYVKLGTTWESAQKK